MAQNSSGIHAWAHLLSFPDSGSWIADAFLRENEALTRALQISLSDGSSDLPLPTPPPPPSISAPVRNSAVGRISKRKSRASKRSPTTYITADPANFRQMVQEVTGIRLGEVGLPVDPLPGSQPGPTGLPQGYLPTLDTSALLLDRVACASFGPDAPLFDFDPLPSFPTLESWGM